MLLQNLEVHLSAYKAVLWLRRLVAGLPPRRPGFDPGSVLVGFVVDKVALGQVFLRLLRFSSVTFIPPVLHYTEKRNKLIIFVTVLHNKPQGCGASVASAAGPFHKKKVFTKFIIRPYSETVEVISMLRPFLSMIQFNIIFTPFYTFQ